MTATLPVIEIFHSIQGEGTRVGEPSTFIRLAGCNLRCTWCDTPYSWNAEGVRDAVGLTPADIAAQVRERAVVLTGGEPMLHARRLPQLLESLRGAGVAHVTVETNATIFEQALVGLVDLWSLSPKLPASGEAFPHETVRRYLGAGAAVQLKFVVADGAGDWQAMWRELEACGADAQVAPIIVQPDGLRADYDAALRELSELVIDDDGEFAGVPRRTLVRVIPQVHRIAWGAAARGV